MVRWSVSLNNPLGLPDLDFFFPNDKLFTNKTAFSKSGIYKSAEFILQLFFCKITHISKQDCFNIYK